MKILIILTPLAVVAAALIVIAVTPAYHTNEEQNV